MDFYFLQGLRRERGGSASPSRKEDSRISNLYTIDAFHVGNVGVFCLVRISQLNSCDFSLHDF